MVILALSVLTTEAEMSLGHRWTAYRSLDRMHDAAFDVAHLSKPDASARGVPRNSSLLPPSGDDGYGHVLVAGRFGVAKFS